MAAKKIGPYEQPLVEAFVQNVERRHVPWEDKGNTVLLVKLCGGAAVLNYYTGKKSLLFQGSSAVEFQRRFLKFVQARDGPQANSNGAEQSYPGASRSSPGASMNVSATNVAATLTRPIEDGETRVTFGKHKEKSFEEVYSTEKGYVNWVMEVAGQPDASQGLKSSANYFRARKSGMTPEQIRAERQPVQSGSLKRAPAVDNSCGGARAGVAGTAARTSNGSSSEAQNHSNEPSAKRSRADPASSLRVASSGSRIPGRPQAVLGGQRSRIACPQGPKTYDLYIYFDGSCLRNVAAATNPAGFGSAVFHNRKQLVDTPENRATLLRGMQHVKAELAGPVVTKELYASPERRLWSTAFLGAEVGSNNTGELSGLAESLLWVLEFGPSLAVSAAVSPAAPIGAATNVGGSASQISAAPSNGSGPSQRAVDLTGDAEATFPLKPLLEASQSESASASATAAANCQSANGSTSCSRSKQLRVLLMYDSEYAARACTGANQAKKNATLIMFTRYLLHRLRGFEREPRSISAGPVRISVEFEHVKGHSGNYGNELADKLANRGGGELRFFALPTAWGRWDTTGGLSSGAWADFTERCKGSVDVMYCDCNEVAKSAEKYGRKCWTCDQQKCGFFSWDH